MNSFFEPRFILGLKDFLKEILLCSKYFTYPKMGNNILWLDLGIDIT